MGRSFILRFQCPNRPGIVAKVATFIMKLGGDILDAKQFTDVINNRFFMRVEFSADDSYSCEALREAAAPLAAELGLEWELRSSDARKKVLIMVSKFDHCLGDLLYRYRIGELPMDVVAIVSNHPREALTTALIQDIPFYHLPITKDTKAQQEARVREIVAETGAELVVLARYMQILSDEMAGFLSGRCINIHHSFLPGFKGAKPYHQAWDRGVKMIGATAHYVTADLDEGPIIHQDVEVISHSDYPDDLVRKGRDVERRVLAEALHLHLEDRVFTSNTRTVVFRS